MHPLLATKGRIAIYLLVWLPLGALLGYLLAMQGRLTWIEAGCLALPLALFYSFVCLAPWYVCRVLPLGFTQIPKLLGNHIAAAVVAGLLWIVAANLLVMGLGRYFAQLSEHFRQHLPLLFGIGVLLYLLSVALHYALLLDVSSKEAETRAQESRTLAREAELKAWKAQINPHFVFNCLHSISALTTVDGVRARDMCIKLSDFLRSTLSLGDICKVPPLFLQPLVENAVKHGIAGLVDGGTIRLQAHCGEGWLRVRVENEFDQEVPAARRHGLGLQNVRNRLRALYENQARLDTTIAQNVFVVEVHLPCFWESSFQRLDALLDELKTKQ